jgi:hypothetical protein
MLPLLYSFFAHEDSLPRKSLMQLESILVIQKGSGEMSVFVVETYLVAPEKREKFKLLMRRLLEYKKENPKLFEEVRSLKLFSQMFGGIAGTYIEMWEFDGMADLEKCWKQEDQDEEFMKIHQEFLQLIDPTTFSMKIWNSVM